MISKGIWLFLFTLSVLSQLRAQCVSELAVGEAAGVPGATVPVEVIGEASCKVTGFSLAIGHDDALVSFVDATPGPFLVEHAGSDLSFQVNAQSGYTVIGALFDISFPLTIPATVIASGTVLATMNYKIVAGANSGSTVLLNRTKTYGGGFPVANIFSRPPGGVPLEPVLVDGLVTVEESVRFRRGDANEDGNLDLSDVVTILVDLFGGRPTPCQKSADVDDSGTITISDAVFLVVALFAGGPVPPDPLVDCGEDRTMDDLTCESNSPCFSL